MPPEKRDPEPDSSPPLRPLKRPVATAENEVLQSLVSGSVAQVVLAVAAVLALSYAGKLPLVTMLLSLLVAFVLAPVSDFLERWRSFSITSIRFGPLARGWNPKRLRGGSLSG
jgi:hypothetical protein